MGQLRRIATLACILALSVTGLGAAAAVTWDDSLTDPRGDVMNLATVVAGRGEVDILSASVAAQGTDVNITLTLASAYNSSGIYSVVVTADGTRDYTFNYITMAEFTASGPGVTDLPGVSGNISADGKRISWTLPQSAFVVTTRLEIKEAFAQHLDETDYKAYIDTADAPVTPDDGEIGPMKVEMVYAFESITRIKMTLTTYAEGNLSKLVRSELDKNHDGTVSQAEKDEFVSKAQSGMGNDTNLNMTLDGKNATSESYAVDYNGVVGSVNSTSVVSIVMTITVVFPDADSAKTHTYRYGSGGGSTTPGDTFDNVTDDSVYRILAPKGWKFDRTEWPSAMRPFFSTDGTKLEVEGKDFPTVFGSSSGNMTSFTITKKKAEESPGMAAVMATAALAAGVALLATTRRRRG